MNKISCHNTNKWCSYRSLRPFPLHTAVHLVDVVLYICTWGQKKFSQTRWSVHSAHACPISWCIFFRTSGQNLCLRGCLPLENTIGITQQFSCLPSKNRQLTVYILDPWPLVLGGTVLHLLQQWILLLSSHQVFCLTVSICGSLLSSAIAVAMVNGHSSGSPSSQWMDNPFEKLNKMSGCICWEQVSMYFSMLRSILDYPSVSEWDFPGLYVSLPVQPPISALLHSV